MRDNREQLAFRYKELLETIYQGCGDAPFMAPPPEIQIQGWWHAGQLPVESHTVRHGTVRILERGRWNRTYGPDFTHAEIELNGQRLRGSIEIDPRAQDWEAHGHGANPAFEDVILHVVFTPPPAGWYTRDRLHRDVAILYLPPECWPGTDQHRHEAPLPRCRRPLAAMQADSIINLLKAAAAYRQEIKRNRFRRKAAVSGESQAWYEAWASTLGYHANKEAMQLLAMRAPVSALKDEAEAILLGTAGFLLPTLPLQTSQEARDYHRKVWDAWWVKQDQFALASDRRIPWN